MDTSQATREDKLMQQVNEALEIVAPVWPLETFIAVNHLAGFERFPFEDAMSKMSRIFNGAGFLPKQNYQKYFNIGRITTSDLTEARRSLQLTEDSAGRPEIYSAFKNMEDLDNSENETVFAGLTALTETSDLTGNTDLSWQLTLSDWVEKLTQEEATKRLNQQTIKWCANFLDHGNAVWTMPHRENGLFFAWRKLAAYDLTLPAAARKAVTKLPAKAGDSLLRLFDILGLETERRVDYLTRQLALLPGWASHIKWCQLNSDNPAHSNIVLDFLTIRTFLDIELNRPVLKNEFGIEPNLPALGGKIAANPEKYSIRPVNRKSKRVEPDSIICQEALEINYRNRLLATLSADYKGQAVQNNQADVQMVFCIDVRSEGIRRRLEAQGNYQTIGFAGFFGFPVNYQAFSSHTNRALCPVLLKPQHTICEVPLASKQKPLSSWLSVRTMEEARHDVMHLLRSNFLAKFYFAEAIGIWFAPAAVARSFFPAAWHKALKKISGNRSDLFALALDTEESATPGQSESFGLSLETKVKMAAGALRGMGLTGYIAPLVVVCGHGSSSENNPFAYSLDCGACGGNAGGVNARLAAAVLNEKQVRAKLSEQDLHIPANTRFIAAEHNTTTDSFVFFDEGGLPAGHLSLLKKLKEDLLSAGENLRAERGAAFNPFNYQAPDQRAIDWSQTRPEWGLARNAAFIAGNRALSKGKNLERRAFLHDYDASTDPNLQVLELIMTAPLVVAQWINTQYYLSTVDNNTFGAGSKTTHNVVGELGVMQGACSDLKIGLPWESIAAHDDQLYHEPMRLLAVIEATRENIDTVVSRNQGLKQLVLNRWIRLVAIDQGQFWEARHGGWELLKVEPLQKSTQVSTH